MSAETMLLGAVAYDPKVVTIWEGLRAYFREQGLPLDFALFSNYERQVEMLLQGKIDLAWNTPLAHLRHALAHDPALPARLEAAVRRRSATLAGASGVPAPIQDALTILAAHGTEPRSVARGHARFRELLEVMHQARVKRLVSAGLSSEQALGLSMLHTPNFM